MNSLEYTARLASAAGLLCSAVSKLRAELGSNAYLLDSYVPLLFMRLGNQAFDEMIGLRYREDTTSYRLKTREKLLRCGAAEKLDLLDMLARECVCAIGLLEE